MRSCRIAKIMPHETIPTLSAFLGRLKASPLEIDYGQGSARRRPKREAGRSRAGRLVFRVKTSEPSVHGRRIHFGIDYTIDELLPRADLESNIFRYTRRDRHSPAWIDPRSGLVAAADIPDSSVWRGTLAALASTVHPGGAELRPWIEIPIGFARGLAAGEFIPEGLGRLTTLAMSDAMLRGHRVDRLSIAAKDGLGKIEDLVGSDSSARISSVTTMVDVAGEVHRPMRIGANGTLVVFHSPTPLDVVERLVDLLIPHIGFRQAAPAAPKLAD